MSIRTFLTLVIAVMGAALIVVVGSRMLSEAERSVRAHKVAALAEVSQSLLPALISSRIERGTAVVAGMAADPADDASWQRLAEQRRITDAMAARSIAALQAAPLQDSSLLPEQTNPSAPPATPTDGAALAQRLSQTHDRLTAMRPAIDAALALPREKRDPKLLEQYGQTSADYVLAITAAAEAVEQATALFDPEIDRLIYLNRQASAARNYASVITLRMESADAFRLPWRPVDIIDAAADRGRADLAWQQVLAVSAAPGVPDALKDAVAAAQATLTGPAAKRQAEIIAGLQSGRPSDVPVSELQRLDTGLLDPVNEVLRVSTAAIVRRAQHTQDRAEINLAGAGAMLLVVLALTGIGLTAVHRRVSLPLKRITRLMSQLKEPGPEIGGRGGNASDIEFPIEDAKRDDEIGEMARALILFRRQVADHGRRLQEHEMRQFLETLIDAIPVSITFKDADLRYRYVNRSRREALGAGSDQLIGKRLSEVVDAATAAPVETSDRAVLATGEAKEFEQARTGPDGEPAIIWSLKTPFRDADGKIGGIITCGVDITRLKEIEAELKAQREKAEGANRAKSAFLASMSHELRTPLNAIIGFADALAKGYLGELGRRQQEYVGDIRTSGEHLLNLVNDLLDLSSLEIGRQVLAIGDCKFDGVAEAALNMVQPQAAEAEVRLDFAPTGITLPADERALTQILVNLLGNAIKFSPPGGEIALRATQGSDGVRIEVADSGFGMTEAQRVNALAATLVTDARLGHGAGDPYKSRPKGGAGLGLAICRRLIEQHNGTLEIESARGQGSTVYVVLPGG